MYPVVDVSRWLVAEPENAGGDEKYWLGNPSEELWLYKPRTEHNDWVQGEDWAEKISASTARVLGVPCATVELADRDGRRGTISLSLRPPGWELQHGAVLLSRLHPGYTVKSKHRAGHTVANIEQALCGVRPPYGWAEPDKMTGFDVFVGYLILDALVANQDRHEENWAIIRPLPGEGSTMLAGSYDHASSLGFNLQDRRRTLLLERGLIKWAARARGQRFEHATDGQLSLVALACSALRRCSPTGERHWRRVVASCQATCWRGIVEQV